MEGLGDLSGREGPSMNAGRNVLIVLFGGLLVGVLCLLPGPASVAATQGPPQCPGVDLAPALTRDPDLNPDGSPVRISPGRAGGYVPIVMIHGWTGRATHDNARDGSFSHKIDLTANHMGHVVAARSLIGQLQGVGGTAVYTFDYHQLSGRWVNDPGIGPRLGTAIDCLREATGQKVILVAHSMGGLAAREALSLRGPKNQNRAHEVSQVITFGTPETGSVAASIIGGLVNGAPGEPAAVFRLVLAECGRQSSGSIETGSLCDMLPAFVRAFDGVGGQALRAGSPELRSLPMPHVPFHALAGQTTFTVPRAGWFALPWQTDDVDMGDMIVTAGSAMHGAVDSKQISCHYQLNAVRGFTDQIGLRVGLVARNDVADVPLGAFTGPCFHTDLMRSIGLTNEALGLVADDVDSRQPTRPADLLRAPVPSLCGIPAGNLQGGVLPAPQVNAGQVWLSYPYGTTKGAKIATPDVTGDGVDDAVAVMNCNAGGVPWPQSVQFYTGARPTRLGGVVLSFLSQGDRDFVQGFTPIRRGVHVRWSANRGSDFGCCATQSFSADLTWNGSRVVASKLTRYDELPTVHTLLQAMQERDRSTIERYAKPELVQTLLTAPPPRSSTPRCYGSGPIMDSSFPPDVLDAYGGEWPPPTETSLTDYGLRHCLVDLGTPTPAILGMSPDGWNKWQAVHLETRP